MVTARSGRKQLDVKLGAKQATRAAGRVFGRPPPADVILGLVPRIHRAASSEADRSLHPRCPVLRLSLRFSPAERWILGPRPRMTVECAASEVLRQTLS